MKKITVFLFLMYSLSTIAQEKLNLTIDNPEPRVGQRVTFSIDINFLTDYFKKELGNNIEFTRSRPVFGGQSDNFDRVIVFEKSKKYKIGPLDFKFNGKKYTTNSIEINVLPELPMENGLWLRLTEFDGQKYLILEQLIRNESNKTYNESGGISHTVGGVKPQGIEFALLNEEPVNGITLSNYSSSNSTIPSEDGDVFDVGFSYSIKKYKINFDEQFTEAYVISTRDIENLPENFDIGKIVLEN